MSQRLRVLTSLLFITLTLAAGCADSFRQEQPDPYQQFELQVQQTFVQRADWHTPRTLTVDESQRIGLSIGDAAALKPQIERLIRRSYPQPAGEVTVGPNLRVTLQADPDDATVVPSEAIDQSSSRQTRLLFTWLVRPKHPSAGLNLTAHVEVPMRYGSVIATDVPLEIPVRRTLSYTVGRLYENWEKIVAILTALGGAVLWLARRRRRPKPLQPDKGGGTRKLALAALSALVALTVGGTLIALVRLADERSHRVDPVVIPATDFAPPPYPIAPDPIVPAGNVLRPRPEARTALVLALDSRNLKTSSETAAQLVSKTSRRNELLAVVCGQRIVYLSTAPSGDDIVEHVSARNPSDMPDQTDFQKKQKELAARMYQQALAAARDRVSERERQQLASWVDSVKARLKQASCPVSDPSRAFTAALESFSNLRQARVVNVEHHKTIVVLGVTGMPITPPPTLSGRRLQGATVIVSPFSGGPEEQARWQAALLQSGARRVVLLTPAAVSELPDTVTEGLWAPIHRNPEGLASPYP